MGLFGAKTTESETFPLTSDGLARIETLKSNLTELQNKFEETNKGHPHVVADFRRTLYNLPAVANLENEFDGLVSKVNNIHECSDLLDENIYWFSKFAIEHRLANEDSNLKLLGDTIALKLDAAGHMHDKITHHADLCERNETSCTTIIDFENKLKYSAGDVEKLWSDYQNLNEIKFSEPVNDKLLNQVNLSIIKPVEYCLKSKPESSLNTDEEEAREEDPACTI